MLAGWLAAVGATGLPSQNRKNLAALKANSTQRFLAMAVARHSSWPTKHDSPKNLCANSVATCQPQRRGRAHVPAGAELDNLATSLAGDKVDHDAL